MKIIVDAMGGDNAPEAIVKGAALAACEYGCEIVLVGDEARMKAILDEADTAKSDRITVVHASEVVEMEDNPSTVVRQKKDSSLVVALHMLADGEGDAFVCAGSTGAVLAGATFIVKRIRGIRRAALAPMLPTQTGGALLIDCGANSECTPEYLLQFGYMGYFYAKKQLGLQNPRVGLINNGAEETKGTEMVKAAYTLLKEAGEEGRINFTGNVEGRDVLFGAADVLVCDGFTGNILLKSIEGTGLYLYSELKKVFLHSLKTKLAAAMVKPGMKSFKKMFDYKEVGGAPLLGISKPIIKAHGSSDAVAFKNAVRQTIEYAQSGIVEDIKENVAYMSVPAKLGKNQ